MQGVQVRTAVLADVPVIERLIERSVFALQAPDYSAAQMAAAVGTVFGVDRRLIGDGTYFIAEVDGRAVGCGGWSFRRTLFGGDAAAVRDDADLDPAGEPARIRAFFVSPEHARRGIGSLLMARCEQAAAAHGFRSLALVATLTGERLYLRHGFEAEARYDVATASGIALPMVGMTKRL